MPTLDLGGMPMSPVARGVGLSDIGRVRRRNEDAYHLADDGAFAVVADGMGGGPAGDVAAQTAVEEAVASLAVSRNELGSNHEGTDRAAVLLRCVDRAVEQANDRVIEKGHDDPALQGMGCTLTVLILDPQALFEIRRRPGPPAEMPA